jgi:hypothetical protein
MWRFRIDIVCSSYESLAKEGQGDHETLVMPLVVAVPALTEPRFLTMPHEKPDRGVEENRLLGSAYFAHIEKSPNAPSGLSRHHPLHA